MPQLIYKQHREKLTSRMLFITGVPRSGTTILGKIVASMSDVEYDYEPWFLAQLPILVSEKMIAPSIAGQLLEHYFCELFHEKLIGRNANMRITDDSYALNSMSQLELTRRWTRLFSRDDSRRDATRRRALMAAKMVNLQPFVPFFKKVFPAAKWIHIVRHPFDVAASLSEKGWYESQVLASEESLTPRKVIRIRERKKYLPWWVSVSDKNLFFSLNSFDRGLLNWLTMIRLWKRSRQLLAKNLFEIQYESILSDPRRNAKRLASFVGCAITPATRKMIRTVRSAVPHKVYQGKNHKLLQDTAKVAKEFGYEIV